MGLTLDDARYYQSWLAGLAAGVTLFLASLVLQSFNQNFYQGVGALIGAIVFIVITFFIGLALDHRIRSKFRRK